MEVGSGMGVNLEERGVAIQFGIIFCGFIEGGNRLGIRGGDRDGVPMFSGESSIAMALVVGVDFAVIAFGEVESVEQATTESARERAGHHRLEDAGDADLDGDGIVGRGEIERGDDGDVEIGQRLRFAAACGDGDVARTIAATRVVVAEELLAERGGLADASVGEDVVAGGHTFRLLSGSNGFRGRSGFRHGCIYPLRASSLDCGGWARCSWQVLEFQEIANQVLVSQLLSSRRAVP